MRTTIRIDDHLLKEAKQFAVKSDISLTALIEIALKEKLYKRKRIQKKSLQLITFKGKGLKRGVDLDDSAALLELMDDQ